MRNCSIALCAALMLVGACSKESKKPTEATSNKAGKDPAATKGARATGATGATGATRVDPAKPPAEPADKLLEVPPPKGTAIDAAAAKAIFSTPVKTLKGKPSSLGAHKGKALLVVNVASKCGLTPQYADLEKLHKEYAARGFSVVGFPCNQFGGQEPGSSEEIAEFCSTTYGITFPMFEKIEVNGDGRHPIYKQLTKVPDIDGKAGDIQWNFEKFVISADGKTITRFRPRTKPYDPRLVAAIKAALPAKK